MYMNKDSFLEFFTIALICGLTMVSCNEKQVNSNSKESVSIQQTGDSIYTLVYADLCATVDFKKGGRLESLSLGGYSFLSGKKVNSGNWGTSLWPSPQSAWGWPPSMELDNMNYAILQDSNEVILKSRKDPKQGFVFTKAYKINTADTSLVITYTILNDTSISQKVAPWEISRVAPGGLTFYPSGVEAKRGQLAPLTKDSAGITWFNYDSARIPEGVPKLLADGKEGWMAQVNNGYILVKKFQDVGDGKYAPEEGEIELYANPDRSYIEIEQQGEYAELMPGASINYVVIYKLRKLSDTSAVKIGNTDLITIARTLSK